MELRLHWKNKRILKALQAKWLAFATMQCNALLSAASLAKSAALTAASEICIFVGFHLNAWQPMACLVNAPGWLS